MNEREALACVSLEMKKLEMKNTHHHLIIFFFSFLVSSHIFLNLGEIMKKNKLQYPPYIYLLQIAERCVNPVYTYIMLWQNANESNKVHIYKKDIRETFRISRTVFSNHCFTLMKEGLLTVDETPKSLHIELLPFDIDAEGFGLS